MATKNISITEEAYKRLAGFRRKNESFSEIIIEITTKNKLEDFFGILSGKAGEELEKNIKRGREEHGKLRERRMREISNAFSGR